MENSLYNYATELVADWKVGGRSTWAASDVRQLGFALDAEFERLSQASREEVISAIKWREHRLRNERMTGAEMRLFKAQIERLNRLYEEEA